MKAESINVGDVLTLKPDHNYGFSCRTITVTRIDPRPGYRVPWVVATYTGDEGLEWEGFFKPSEIGGRA